MENSRGGGGQETIAVEERRFRILQMEGKLIKYERKERKK
jgi:hypothetical protein